MENDSLFSNFENSEKSEENRRLRREVSISTQEDDLDRFLYGRPCDLMIELDDFSDLKTSRTSTVLSDLCEENERLKNKLFALEAEQEANAKYLLDVLKQVRAKVIEEDTIEVPETKTCKCTLF